MSHVTQIRDRPALPVWQSGLALFVRQSRKLSHINIDDWQSFERG